MYLVDAFRPGDGRLRERVFIRKTVGPVFGSCSREGADYNSV